MSDFMTAIDFCEELEISRSSAYKIIGRLNEELREKGYLTLTGKVPRWYFQVRYNMKPENE